MKRRLPSLLAVRNFESVGRNLSFTLAADELNVTQAAVSHQVRLLEEEIGVKLFERFHQRIELTAEGAQLLEVATECLDRLADTIDVLSGRGRAERIHMSVTPLISAHWLMPRLGSYLAAHSNAEIVLHHSLEPPSERDAKFDLKIFFSPTKLDNPAHEFLFADALVPVSTPDLLRDLGRKPVEQILAKVNLVHEFNYDWWCEWCRRSGVDPTLVERGIVLDDPAVLENAALLGRGMILGSMLFLSERLRSGELVLPFGIAHTLPIFYYLSAPRRQSRPSVQAFRRWLTCLAQSQHQNSARSA